MLFSRTWPVVSTFWISSAVLQLLLWNQASVEEGKVLMAIAMPCLIPSQWCGWQTETGATNFFSTWKQTVKLGKEIEFAGNFWEHLPFGCQNRLHTCHLPLKLLPSASWLSFLLLWHFFVKPLVVPCSCLICVTGAPVAWAWGCRRQRRGGASLGAEGPKGSQKASGGRGEEGGWAACLWRSWASWCQPFTREKAKKERIEKQLVRSL